MFISLVTTLVSWLLTRQMVRLIWVKFPWEKYPVWHIILGILLILVFSMFTSVMIYYLNRWILDTEPGYWQRMLPIRIGTLIAFTVIILVHESVLLFYKWKNELTRAANLEKENLRSKFDALKNHINPHFLFNSLGTLASLIRSDPGKAEKYTDEFARIYRYLLDVNSNEIVTIGEEVSFINSYVFLQQIRFGDGFSFQNSVDPFFHASYILPLTLQLLVENALKHNTTQVASPLIIEVFADAARHMLVVRNNYQPRGNGETTGTGLRNLEERYSSFLGRSIRYGREDRYFVVEIPIISEET
jgi:sensor histidine kinase YesM